MSKYIIKRLLQSIPLVILISVIVFFLIKLAPYDAIDAMITPDMEPETIEMIRARYGYDKPAYIQYLSWFRGMLRGEFGYSIQNKMPIGKELAHRIPSTLKLMLPAYAISYLLAIVLGLIAGYNRGGLVDRVIDGFCSMGISVPGFWLAMLLIYFLGFKYKLLPVLGMYTVGAEKTFGDFFLHLIMPCTVLIVVTTPSLIRYVRSSTIGQLSEDYVMIQKSFGAKDREILFKHIYKNVLLPIITRFGMTLPNLVTGAIITESVFSWPGVGPYFVKAVSAMDFPVIMTILLLSSLLVVLGSLLADILYSIVDPRIKDMG